MGGIALLVTLLSGWAERRRTRRANIDSVGFMPWPLITVMGTICTLFLFAFALKAST